VHQSPKPYDPTTLKNKELLRSVLKLPAKKESLAPTALHGDALKIGERSLGNILQQAEKTAKTPTLAVVQEKPPEEYDGKIRSGTILFIGETTIRQAHDFGYNEYNIKDFKPNDLPKLLAAMLRHSTIGFLWNKLESRFEFYIAEPSQHAE
jgi:hypothetical protein